MPHAPYRYGAAVADIWSLLQARRRADPGVPMVTYVDLAAQERTELSVASVENAAAKIANALQQEYDLGPGARVALHLPLHWQRSTWCAGIWTAGCVVVPGAPEADLIVADPDAAGHVVGRDVAVVSMHPFGLPHSGPLPPGAEDVTLTVRQQPDAFLGAPPAPTDAALTTDDRTWDQSELLEWARDRAGRWGLSAGGRLLVDDATDPLDAWVGCLAAPLALGASVVLVRGDGSDVADQERITARA